MRIERETLVEIVVSVVAVGLFIAAVVAVGTTFGDGQLTDQGALALVGVIVGFILLMTLTGWWLSAQEWGSATADGDAVGRSNRRS